MQDARFGGVKLGRCQFVDCDLRRADFTGADLREVALDGCELTEAVFEATDLRGADLREAAGYTIDPVRNRVRGARFSLPDALGLLRQFGVRIEG